MGLNKRSEDRSQNWKVEMESWKVGEWGKERWDGKRRVGKEME
jgi:hypothetical protein